VVFFVFRNVPGWRNWQTRRTQNPVTARSCRFDSYARHQTFRHAQEPPTRSAVVEASHHESRLAKLTCSIGGAFSRKREADPLAVAVEADQWLGLQPAAHSFCIAEQDRTKAKIEVQASPRTSADLPHLALGEGSNLHAFNQTRWNAPSGTS
jgi:hypothetical protein